MTMHWWRCMHGAPFDPKWRVVALAAKTEPGKVWAVVSALYDRASQAKDRGDVAGAGLDEIAEGFGWPVDDIQRIYSALKAKAVIIDNRIATWEKHQPKRERPADNSAERVRRHREKKKAEALALHGVTSVTPKQADVTPPVTVRNGHVTDVTVVTVLPPLQATGEAQSAAKNDQPCNATVTPRNAQRREELLSSSSKNQNLVEPLLVCLDSKPPSTRPGSKPISSKREHQGTRWTLEAVPESWITDALKAYPIVDVRHEALAFVNHWISAPGSKGLKLNWRATWMGWIQREAKRLKEKSNGRSNGQYGRGRKISDHPRGIFGELGDELVEVPGGDWGPDHAQAIN